MLNGWVKRKDKEKNKYYGVVVGINDPLHRNRVQIRVDELHKGVPDELLPFFRPKDYKGNSLEADVNIPAIGTRIEVGFEEEDFYNGVYYQGLPDKNSANDSFYNGYPNFKGFKTSSGNIVKWYDNGDLDVISSSGETLYLREGKFTLSGNLKIIGNLEVSENITVTKDITCTNLSATTEVTANSIPLSTHKHDKVQTGSDVSGTPVVS